MRVLERAALALAFLAAVAAPTACGGATDGADLDGTGTTTPAPASSAASGADGGMASATPGGDAGAAPGTAGGATPPPDFAWYVLDETSGTTAHDSSPHHFDITNLTGVAWGEGATFDGATVCGSTSVDPELRAPPVTMAAWLTPAPRADESVTSYALNPFPPGALSGDVPSLGGYSMGLDVWTDDGGGAAVSFEHGIGDDLPGFHSREAPFAAGSEYLVALVADSSTATIYVNGALFAQEAANLPPSVTPTPLHLGCTNGDSGYLSKGFFDGRIRDARIYKRVLPATEIAQLYASGPTTRAPPPSSGL